MSTTIQPNRLMTMHCPDVDNAPVDLHVSRFQGSSGVDEYHLMAHPTESGSFAEQLEWIERAYRAALDSLGLPPATCVMRRFFCSDLANQAGALAESSLASAAESPCAISVVCQPPVPPAKVGLWAYHISDPDGALDKTLDRGSLLLNRGELGHLWTTGLACVDRDGSYEQTHGVLETYENCLHARRMHLAEHVVRTWFFVQNVDANYGGLVAARREVFAQRGMTPDTHFIASTGIEGTSADVAAHVTMDAYAISGLRSEQVEFLSAPEHLSPTHIYGVTFERGASIDYRDRRHVLISGTASIDNAGRILYPGDMLRQLDRTLENVEALLQQAGASLQDVCMSIVYVRDVSDVGLAQNAIRERFGETPVQVVVARVCRPGWLIEAECHAIIPTQSPGLPAF